MQQQQTAGSEAEMDPLLSAGHSPTPEEVHRQEAKPLLLQRGNCSSVSRGDRRRSPPVRDPSQVLCCCCFFPTTLEILIETKFLLGFLALPGHPQEKQQRLWEERVLGARWRLVLRSSPAPAVCLLRGWSGWWVKWVGGCQL